MEIILLWTIWATAITSPPDVVVLGQMCRDTHPKGRISISQESLSWNERRYPTAMIICARSAEAETPKSVPAVPEKPARSVLPSVAASLLPWI